MGSEVRLTPVQIEDNSNEWDYLLLVSRWAGTACESMSCNLTIPLTSFTLHGLWANRDDNTYPSFCSGEKFDPSKISDIMTDMRAHWPDYTSCTSTSFWSHEWEKHGTCSASDPSLANQHDFFSEGLNLLGKYQAMDALNQAGIYTSDSKTYSFDDVKNALKSAFGFEAFVSCHSESTPCIDSVFLCVGKDLKLIDCPEAYKKKAESSSQCGTGNVKLPELHM